MLATMIDAIDLHSHTTFSDGSATPAELVERAKANAARAIAITDHDTVGGLAEGLAAAERIGLEFVRGIEISAEYSPGTMHILGYGIDDDCDALLSKLQELRVARDARNPQIAEKLRSLGVDINYDEVASLAGNEVVGRPHFARILVQKGFADSIQDAFNKFLAKGAAAYVEKKRLSPAESIELLHEAGGIAVLAHPYQLKLPSMKDVLELIEHLAALGLDGVEAIYSRHSIGEREQYTEVATQLGLLLTGGSDYHGTYKPDLDIVTGKGDLHVPYSVLENIKSRLSDRNPAHGRRSNAG
ncbi:MAG TPA: PHP domain-containing protein [Blastocatellia bacterium]|nr:PHP domain-containing protein [Blastocatellia bacterium]